MRLEPGEKVIIGSPEDAFSRAACLMYLLLSAVLFGAILGKVITDSLVISGGDSFVLAGGVIGFAFISRGIKSKSFFTSRRLIPVELRKP